MDFYEQTGGLTLLVIKHNGDTFDYVNGYKNNRYFPVWNELRNFMREGKYYVVGCIVKINKSKANLTPFGICFEVEEKMAKIVSLQHRQDVESGNWDPETQYVKLKADWEIYRQHFYDMMLTKINSNEEKTISQLKKEREILTWNM